MAFAVVAVEEGRGRRGVGGEGRAVGEEDVVGAVAVEVEDGGAGAGGFEDVVFAVPAAVSGGLVEGGIGGDVDEVDGGRVGG
jgi:hypothetical protein